jgi:hypothetical protein
MLSEDRRNFEEREAGYMSEADMIEAEPTMRKMSALGRSVLCA